MTNEDNKLMYANSTFNSTRRQKTFRFVMDKNRLRWLTFKPCKLARKSYKQLDKSTNKMESMLCTVGLCLSEHTQKCIVDNIFYFSWFFEREKNARTLYEVKQHTVQLFCWFSGMYGITRWIGERLLWSATRWKSTEMSRG